MVTEAIIGAFFNVMGWFAGLVPGPPAGSAPTSGVLSVLGSFSDGVDQLGAWVPWDVINVVVPISIALYISGLLLRAVKSFIPTISG